MRDVYRVHHRTANGQALAVKGPRHRKQFPWALLSDPYRKLRGSAWQGQALPLNFRIPMRPVVSVRRSRKWRAAKFRAKNGRLYLCDRSAQSRDRENGRRPSFAQNRGPARLCLAGPRFCDQGRTTDLTRTVCDELRLRKSCNRDIMLPRYSCQPIVRQFAWPRPKIIL